MRPTLASPRFEGGEGMTEEMNYEEVWRQARSRARREFPEVASKVRVEARLRRAKPRPIQSGEPGYCPTEMDFCGRCYKQGMRPATFQAVGGKSKRVCPQCGAVEDRERSWHDRTGVPYTTLPRPDNTDEVMG